MKKIYFLTLLLIFSLNLFCQVQWTKHTEWTKHTDNPVMVPGSYAGWDEKMTISAGSVVFHENYHMWYWAGDYNINKGCQIGHATSDDGITWNRDTVNNPILEPGADGTWEETWVNEPSVLYHDTIFHMWYAGHAIENHKEVIRMGHATSHDGEKWTKDTVNNPVLDIGPDGTWDDSWIAGPSVLHDGHQFHMWYMASDGIGETTQIGHATSPDGTTWTKDPQPVLSYGASGEWDYPRMDFPEVIFDGCNYHMWYSGGKYLEYQIGYATSKDGSEWNKSDNNPVLSPGSSGSWDERGVSLPAIMDSAGIKYKMWFTGGNGEVSGVGYAERMVDSSCITNIDEQSQPGFSFSPNPVRTSLTIETGKIGQYSIEIHSLNGQLIHRSRIEGTTSQVDLSSFHKGLYFITVRSRDQVRTEKIIKL